jgi:hypothetical protein
MKIATSPLTILLLIGVGWIMFFHVANPAPAAPPVTLPHTATAVQHETSGGIFRRNEITYIKYVVPQSSQTDLDSWRKELGLPPLRSQFAIVPDRSSGGRPSWWFLTEDMREFVAEEGRLGDNHYHLLFDLSSAESITVYLMITQP